MPDIAVVGGGIVGAAAAYEAARAGANVVLLDADRNGRASDAGAGIMSPQTFVSESPALDELARRAGSYYDSLIEQLDADGHGHGAVSNTGLIRIATAESEVAYFIEGFDRMNRLAPGAVEAITPEQAHDLCPALGPVLRAQWCPSACRVDGRQMQADLLAAGAAAGVERITAAAQSVTVSAGRARAVVTDSGSIAADAVIVSAGAWSAGLLADVAPLSVVPHKGQIVHLNVEADTSKWPIIQPVFGYYLVPWPDSRVACGGTIEPAAAFNAAPTTGGLHELLREALKTAPGLSGGSVRELRVGLRPVTPDELPLIGPVGGVDNLIVCTGHGYNGLLMGPFSAAAAVTVALGSVPPMDLGAFDPARFA